MRTHSILQAQQARATFTYSPLTSLNTIVHPTFNRPDVTTLIQAAAYYGI